MSIPGAQERITQAVTSWDGVSFQPHRFGGVEYVIGRREIGHIHGNHLVDIPFPKKVRDEIVAAGRAQPHHLLPETGWVSFYLRHESDVEQAIALLRQSYQIAQKQKSKTLEVNMNNKMIAVTGATGQQGGAVARKLLADGWKVRALTRDVNKPAAQELKSLGAELIPGDMDNRAELDEAFRGVYGVFSVQNFWLPNVGFEGEIRQGKAVADAARAAGVQHLVYSSVGAAHRGMGQKHFESKYQIEQYIESLEIPHTILRPAAFMENYNWSRAYILNGSFSGFGLMPGKTIQIIATEDIGVFAALAFANPGNYLGKTIELSGDELTEPEIAGVFSTVIGRPVALAPRQNQEGAAPTDEQIAMFKFFNGEAYTADIAALRKIYPGLLTLEQYLRKNGWENAQPIPIPENSGWGR